jgi:hypothetical protein
VPKQGRSLTAEPTSTIRRVAGRLLFLPRLSAQTLEGETVMLWTIFVILMIMWLLGVTTSYTLGGFIHILLLLAIASVLIQIIQGRRPI